MKHIIKLCLVAIFLLPITGCAGAGFDKRATLMPDSISVGFGQSRYREEDAAYRGFTVTAQWNLK